MRKLPIPYTEAMVKSLLLNIKNMTRRTKGLEIVNENPDDWKIVSGDWSNSGVLFFNKNGHSDRMKPKYQVGDQLWVKETFSHAPLTKETKPFYPKLSDYIYKAGSNYSHIKWTTGRFMPKAAARIWLEVTDVKCERLLDITQEDANAEGVERWEAPGCNWNRYKDYMGNVSHWCDARTSFISLWQKINGLASVKLNPWVFVYTFKRIDKPDD